MYHGAQFQVRLLNDHLVEKGGTQIAPSQNQQPAWLPWNDDFPIEGFLHPDRRKQTISMSAHGKSFSLLSTTLLFTRLRQPSSRQTVLLSNYLSVSSSPHRLVDLFCPLVVWTTSANLASVFFVTNLSVRNCIAYEPGIQDLRGVFWKTPYFQGVL